MKNKKQAAAVENYSNLETRKSVSWWLNADHGIMSLITDISEQYHNPFQLLFSGEIVSKRWYSANCN